MGVIFLIGMPGCGKTTLGRALAAEMDVAFVDLDEYIEERCEASISQIFEQAGEPVFREIERKALLEVAAMQHAIVACGGGTPCQPGNMEIINAHGLSIWLTTNAQRITERLCLPEQKAKRPAIAHMTDAEVLDYVTRQMAERKPHYEQAMLRFDSTRLESVEEIAATAHALATLLLDL